MNEVALFYNRRRSLCDVIALLLAMNDATDEVAIETSNVFDIMNVYLSFVQTHPDGYEWGFCDSFCLDVRRLLRALCAATRVRNIVAYVILSSGRFCDDSRMWRSRDRVRLGIRALFASCGMDWPWYLYLLVLVDLRTSREMPLFIPEYHLRAEGPAIDPVAPVRDILQHAAHLTGFVDAVAYDYGFHTQHADRESRNYAREHSFVNMDNQSQRAATMQRACYVLSLRRPHAPSDSLWLETREYRTRSTSAQQFRPRPDVENMLRKSELVFTRSPHAIERTDENSLLLAFLLAERREEATCRVHLQAAQATLIAH